MWGKGNSDFWLWRCCSLKGCLSLDAVWVFWSSRPTRTLYQHQKRLASCWFQPCQRTCCVYYTLTLDNRKKRSSSRVRSTTTLKSSHSSHQSRLFARNHLGFRSWRSQISRSHNSKTTSATSSAKWSSALAVKLLAVASTFIHLLLALDRLEHLKHAVQSLPSASDRYSPCALLHWSLCLCVRLSLPHLEAYSNIQKETERNRNESFHCHFKNLVI